jgi:acyl-CoA thioesterase
MTYEFDDALTLVGDPAATVFPERWTVAAGFAHGGYLMSVALAAASHVSTHTDPVTMSAHFVRPGKAGAAEVPTRVVKSGRSLSTVAADIVQDGRVEVTTITTFGDLSNASDILFQDVDMPMLPSRDDCIKADASASSIVPRMINNLDLYLTPESAAWTQGKTLENATMQGWVRFADEKPIDCVSLPMFADALPPPVFNVGAFAPWTPTVELTLHVRRIPDTSWLGVSFRTDLIGGMFFESSGTLWDDQGRLVAMSRQLQLIQR